MKTILIITAMPEEIALLQHLFPSEKETPIGPFIYHESQQETYKIISVVCGIGKVNAAICTTLGQQTYQPDLVINIGVAGGTHPELAIGDVMIASHLQYHDADATTFGYVHGQIPRMPAHYVSDENFANALMKNADQFDFNIMSGLLASGDSFVGDEETHINIKARFPDVLALDMEACGIAQACHQLNTPFLCIRGISDGANDKSKSYAEALPLAMGNAGKALAKFLEFF